MLVQSIKIKIAIIFMVFAVFLTFPGDAFAYIDPGAGSTVYQQFLAIGVAIQAFFKKLRSLFFRSSKRKY